jgi:CRISPR-associated protein Csa3
MSNKADERAEIAFKNVKEMIHKIDSCISIKRIRLDHCDFSCMIMNCIEVIKNALKEQPKPSIIVNLSGGPREILVALTIASISHAPMITRVTCYSDVSRQLSQIDLPYFTSPLQDRELQILRDIKEYGPSSISDIAGRLQISESSISRYCARLISFGVIDLTAQGKRKVAIIKPCAEVILSIKQE